METLTKSLKPKKGLKVTHRFGAAGSDPYAAMEWESRTSQILNPDGSVVFKMDNVRVPKEWSQVATDIMAQKYFRRDGAVGHLFRNVLPACQGLEMLPERTADGGFHQSGLPAAGHAFAARQKHEIGDAVRAEVVCRRGKRVPNCLRAYSVAPFGRVVFLVSQGRFTC